MKLIKTNSSLFPLTLLQEVTLVKKRYLLKVRSNSFRLRFIDSWNALPECVVMTPSLNCFKWRLNHHWKNHPYKFDPWCYIPGPKPRDYYQKAPTEAALACSGVPVMWVMWVMVCAPVRRENPLARGLSTVQAHKPCSISLVPQYPV